MKTPTQIRHRVLMARGKYPLMSNRYPYPREKDPTALKSKDLPGRSQRCWGRKQHPPPTVPHILRVRLKGDDQLAAGFPIPLLDHDNSRQGCSAEEPVRIGGTTSREFSAARTADGLCEGSWS